MCPRRLGLKVKPSKRPVCCSHRAGPSAGMQAFCRICGQTFDTVLDQLSEQACCRGCSTLCIDEAYRVFAASLVHDGLQVFVCFVRTIRVKTTRIC